MLKYQVRAIMILDMQLLQKIQQDQVITVQQEDLYIYQEHKVRRTIQQYYKVERCIIYILDLIKTQAVHQVMISLL